MTNIHTNPHGTQTHNSRVTRTRPLLMQMLQIISRLPRQIADIHELGSLAVIATYDNHDGDNDEEEDDDEEEDNNDYYTLPVPVKQTVTPTTHL